MTRDDITKMAREANLWLTDYERWAAVVRFANLVAAAEREACAKVVENMKLEWGDQTNIAQAERATIMDCAIAIRARGEK